MYIHYLPMTLENENVSVEGGVAEDASNQTTDNINYEELTCESFEDLNLKESILRGIYGYGYEKPSSIQKKAIQPVIDGRDIIAQAQSGTGKTATFSISVLQNIDESLNETQAVILCHTRELALQVQTVIQNLAIC